MYGYDILYGISKVPFEIPHKISYPYIERYNLILYNIEILRLLDLRAHMHFWNADSCLSWEQVPITCIISLLSNDQNTHQVTFLQIYSQGKGLI